MSNTRLALAAAALALTIAPQAQAHGFAGNRFFPGTITVEDPAVADELALPTLSSRDGESEYAIEWGKRITPNFGVSFEGAYIDGDEARGWSNLVLAFKYQSLTDAESETILSAGVEVEWGGSGEIGEDTTTIVPTFYFGHGFGGAGLEWARPFAVTGSIGYAAPLEGHDDEGEPTERAVEAGLTLQYSLPYLSAHVRDHGWPEWVNQLTPLVEFAVEQPVGGSDAELTGTINPGVLWTGRHIQLGAEAIIPINAESGDDVGFALQLHLFMDDLYPHSLGRPIFGAH